MSDSVDIYGVVSVGLDSAGDITITDPMDTFTATLSTTAARKLVDTLNKAIKVSEASYAANVRQAKLEAEILRLQAKLAEKVAALQS